MINAGDFRMIIDSWNRAWRRLGRAAFSRRDRRRRAKKDLADGCHQPSRRRHLSRRLFSAAAAASSAAARFSPRA